MKNELKYYYDLDVQNITQKNNNYHFKIMGKPYVLVLTDRIEKEIEELYDLTTQLNQNHILCHKIIPNKENKLITVINNRLYILMQCYIYSDDKISYGDVIKFTERTQYNWQFNELKRTNWPKLWIEKIQNIEYQINQLGRNNLLCTNSFSYYSGIVENCIQLYNDLDCNSFGTIISVCHKNISYNMSLTEFYNPLNFILDCPVRDVSEYIKSKMINNIDTYDEFYYYFHLQTNDYYKQILFMIRMLFPSNQLNIYEKSLFSKNNNAIEKILQYNDNYENQIKKMYETCISYINKFPHINWLENRYQKY